MKIIKTSFLWLTILIGLGYLSLHLIAWKKCTCSTRFISLKNVDDARTRHCLIAIYKNDHKSEVIILDRILKTEPWKYLFYTPKYYSKEAFINVQILTEDIGLILAGADTLYKSYPMFHYEVKNIPDNFIVYYKNGDTATYRLTEKYQDNFDNIATVPFSEKWDTGPLYNDD